MPGPNWRRLCAHCPVRPSVLLQHEKAVVGQQHARALAQHHAASLEVMMPDDGPPGWEREPAVGRAGRGSRDIGPPSLSDSLSVVAVSERQPAPGRTPPSAGRPLKTGRGHLTAVQLRPIASTGGGRRVYTRGNSIACLGRSLSRAAAAIVDNRRRVRRVDLS